MKRLPALFLLALPLFAGNGYMYSRAITINHSQVSALGGSTSLTNFPVLIAGTYAYLATAANGGRVRNTNGYDVIFTSDAAGNSKLKWEVDSYNTASGAVAYWVQVPSISTSVDTTFYLWYGNANITSDQSNKTGTWDANYRGVWHLSNGTTLSATDSTSSANNGTLQNAPAAGIGKIDGAATFNGSNTAIQAGMTSLAVYPITVSGWWNPANTNDNQHLAAKGYASAITPWEMKTLSGKILWGSYGGSGGAVTSLVAIQANVWQYVTGTYDGSTWALYYNGGLDNLRALSSSGNNAQPVDIGAILIASPAQVTTGLIDEVRISNTVRSAAWIQTEYLNQSSPATFYRVGAEASIAGSLNMPLDTF